MADDPETSLSDEEIRSQPPTYTASKAMDDDADGTDSDSDSDSDSSDADDTDADDAS
jgi:hypothetical protein